MIKKVCILFASPRKNGNTKQLVIPFVDELDKAGVSSRLLDLYDMKIEGCHACRTCQNIWDGFGCPIDDDVHVIFDEILESDLFVLATPIYSWFCTMPMKGVIDRLVYGMNKYFGDERGPSLWKGKELAIISTCGYRVEIGMENFADAMKKYCKHSGLKYKGSLAERDMGYNARFMNEEKEIHARDFAREMINNSHQIHTKFISK